jgi:DNA mismatch endonuclease (patch repair protein)
MQRQRRRDTSPEIALRYELHRRGLRYRVDVGVLPGSRKRHDVVFSRAKVVVEVRGCYWHACPKHSSQPKANAEWWRDKLARNVERDRETAAALNAAGWRLVIVWEHDDAVAAADRIAGIVRKSRTDVPRPVRSRAAVRVPVGGRPTSPDLG